MFEKAISYDRNLDDTWYRWGWTLSKMRKTDEAIEKYRRSVSVNPKHEGAWINLCGLLSDCKRYEDSDKAYDEAVKHFKNPTLLLSNWGFSLIQRGNFQDSIDKFKIAIKYDTYFAPIWNNWSFALAAMGETNDALEKIEMAVKLDPNKAGYWVSYTAWRQNP